MKKLFYIIIILFIISLTSFGVLNKKTKNDKTNVIFWTLQMGTFDKYINNIISVFEKDNPDIKIVWIDVPYSEGEKRTLASILSNNPPDLVNLTPEFSILLAQRKALYTINPELLNDFSPSLLNKLKYNNEYFGFPFYATSALTFYNKDLMKKAGINDIPITYDDMYESAEKMKKNAKSFITMPSLTENDTFLKILAKYNIDTWEKINSPQSKKLFEEYIYLYQNDLIPKESITQTHREALEKYMAGQIAILPAGANFLNIINENSPDVFKLTDISNQLTGTSGKYDFSLMNLIIPKKAKNPEAAIEFALFLTNKENQLELAKLTTVLPVNKNALQDEYFTNIYPNDIYSKARVLSAQQLKNLSEDTKRYTNQKDLTILINNYVQEIILKKAPLSEQLDDLSKQWADL